MQESLELFKDGIISEQQSELIQEYEITKPLSVHWELRTILYLGILLFISGIGILVYLNIDTIGHQAVIALIAAACGYSFYYSYTKRLPYSNAVLKHPSPFFDYVVLAGCLLLGVLTGYLQYQYSVFGNHYGLATLVPTIVFFFCAYLFDHKGVLSLGITGLAAWAGLTVTPLELLNENDFSNSAIIFTAMGIGIAIALFSFFSDWKGIKSHFSFVFNNFACNLVFIASLSSLFMEMVPVVGFLLLAAACYYYIRYAILHQSFLFLLFSVIYGYIGLTYLFFMFFINNLNESAIILIPLYLMASCGGVICFFIFYKRILGIKK